MAMFWSAVSAILALVADILAQSSDVSQCVPEYQWALNSLSQTPCLVAAYLGSQCSDQSIQVNAIPVGNHYLGPTSAQANPCQCSTVTYSLLSACGGCQNRTFTTWDNWSLNCRFVFLMTFPGPIPPAVEVPSWAYLDLSLTNNIFDPVAAQEHVSPSHSSSASLSTILPSSTGTASESDRSDPKPSNNTGVIAGGVVGGIVFLAAITLAALWFFLRSRRSHAGMRRSRPVILDENNTPLSPPPPMEQHFSNPTITTPMSSAVQVPYIYPRAANTDPVSPIYTTAGGLTSSSIDTPPSYNVSQAARGHPGAAI